MASAYWQKRNAAAQAKGYKNYYDYRAHGYGRTAPSAPKATGAALTRLRGHASQAGLVSLATSGRIELAIVEPGAKDKDGRYSAARVIATLDDGSEREFWLTRRQLAMGKDLGQAIRDGGAVLLDSYGLLGASTAAEGPQEVAA